MVKKQRSQTEEDGGITNRQALMYFGLVVVCFAVLYPRIIHPLLKNALGFGENETEKPQEYAPPQYQPRGAPVSGPASRAGMRPPPGARGEASNKQETGGTKGGGMIAMVLPVYAGGIVLYLLFTASKVYYGAKNKKEKRSPHEEVYSLISNKLAGLDLEKVLTGEDAGGADEITKLAEYLRKKRYDEEDIENVELCKEFATEDLAPLYEKNTSRSNPTDAKKQESSSSKAKSRVAKAKAKQTKELMEDASNMGELIRKCENHEPMTPEEMVRLQNRLLDMEGKMSKLMKAMKSVKNQTQDLVEKEVPSTDAAELEVEDSDGESDESDDEFSVDSEELSSSSDGDEVIEICEASRITDSDSEGTPELSVDLEEGSALRRRVVPS